MRLGNRILVELESAEIECIENRIHLGWYSTTALQGRGRSPDGRWAINHADREGTGSRCLHRQGADSGGSREQHCTWLYVSTPPTSQRQAVSDPRQPARTCHSMCCQSYRLLQRCSIRCRERRNSATSNGLERCCAASCWYGEVQPRHPNPPWCPPLAPCTAPNQLQNRHTGSGLFSRHRPGLFRWRLHSCDCSPWTNQPAFSDAWWSCDPSNTNKIGRTEFPYIRTNGVELASWFAQASCYKPRTFPERTENIPV